MSGFKIWDSALEGFRVVRERPLRVAAWTLVAAAALIVTRVITATVAPEASAAYSAQITAGEIDPVALQPHAERLVLAVLLAALPAGLAWAALAGSVTRAVLNPAAGPWSVRLGVRELKLWVLLLVTGAVWFVTVQVIGIAMMIPAALLGGGMAAAQALALLALPLTLYPVARIMTAGARVMDVGRLDLGAAWRDTKGRGLKAWGALAAAVLSAALVMILATIALQPFARMVPGGEVALPASLEEALLTPGAWATLIVSAFAYALVAANLFAVGARVYRSLEGVEAAKA